MLTTRGCQERLLSCFSEVEQRRINDLRNNWKLLGRHPLINLLFSEKDKFASQRIVNLIKGFEYIRELDPGWQLSNDDKNRLLDTSVQTSNGIIGELLVYGYLAEVFRHSERVPRAKTKTPDFKVSGNQNKAFSTSVSIEVHSKGWSSFMQTKLENAETVVVKKLKNGVTSSLKSTELRPFSTREVSHHTEDGISKLAQIGSKSCQIPANDAGIIWMNLDQDDLNLSIQPGDCFPAYSLGSKSLESGIIWNALYGMKNQFIYEGFPRRRPKVMQHDGLFAQNPGLSAVVVSFYRHVVLFENNSLQNPLPSWFREQVLNLRGFSWQSSWMIYPNSNFQLYIASQLERLNDLVCLRPKTGIVYDHLDPKN